MLKISYVSGGGGRTHLHRRWVTMRITQDDGFKM